MARMRTLPKAIEELKAKDPLCAVNLTRLRVWVKEGRIQTVPIGTGKNHLVNMDALEAYLSGQTDPAVHQNNI